MGSRKTLVSRPALTSSSLGERRTGPTWKGAFGGSVLLYWAVALVAARRSAMAVAAAVAVARLSLWLWLSLWPVRPPSQVPSCRRSPSGFASAGPSIACHSEELRLAAPVSFRGASSPSLSFRGASSPSLSFRGASACRRRGDPPAPALRLRIPRDPSQSKSLGMTGCWLRFAGVVIPRSFGLPPLSFRGASACRATRNPQTRRR